MTWKPKLEPFRDEIVAAYGRGESLRLIGERYGVTYVGVCYFLKRTGVPKRATTANAVSWTTERRLQHSEKLKGKPSGAKGKRWKVGRVIERPDISGERNPNWKGGATAKHLLIRTSAEYKAWRRKVFERDNWTCVECGDRSREGHKIIIQADHIEPFSTHPELRFELSNGRTLCKPCHKKTPTYGVNLRYLQASSGSLEALA